MSYVYSFMFFKFSGFDYFARDNKLDMKRTLFVLVFGLLMMQNGFAQFGVLSAGTYQNPLWLAQNILVDPNFTVTAPINFSNGTFVSQSNTAQLGVFYGGNNTSLGIDSGIVMSTGSAIGVVPGSTFTNPNVSTPSANLTNVVSQIMYNYNSATQTPHDKVILAFSFIAPSDSISFEYIFASAEYASYTCSQYNDVFGFFLIGPGINGNTGIDTVNLASIPNTTPPIPVCVNSVNSGTGGTPAYCTHVNPNYTTTTGYFVGNVTGLNSSEITGHTVPFTAEAQVTCGAVYTIKMMVADVSDGILNSHVFLKANSFTVPTLNLSSSTNSGSAITDSLIVEGCPAQEFIVEKSGNLNSDMTINFIKSGTAVEGVDYTNFPDSLYIPAGKSADTIVFYAIDDGVAEPNEDLIITMLSTTTACWSYPSMQKTFYIRDAVPLNVNSTITISGTDTVYCPGETVEIQGGFTGGEANSHGFWLDDPTLPAIRQVTPTQTTTYYYGAITECKADTIIDSVTIYLANYTPMSSTGDSALICQGDQVVIYATPQDGTPPYQITWGNSTVGTSISVSPMDTTWYYYQVIDNCAQVFNDSVRVNVAPQPVASFSYGQNPTNPLSIEFRNHSTHAVSYLWDFGDGVTSSDTTPTVDYDRPGTYPATLTVISEHGCVDDFTYDVLVETDYYLYLPTAFTPDGDGLNEVFGPQGVGFDRYEMIITNRWGNVVFRTNDINIGWDGTFNGVMAKPDVYAYKILITIPVTGEIVQKEGTFILTR